MIRRVAAAAAVLALTTAAPVLAQSAQQREGFWIGFGMGYGSLGAGGDGREGGLSGYLKLGGKLTDKLLLGGETNGWYKSEDGTDITFGNASAALYFYPMTTSGLFVKAGVGYSQFSIEGLGDSEAGFGLLGGVGYDVRIGQNTSITPVVNYFRGQFDGGHADVFQAGLGVTFH